MSVQAGSEPFNSALLRAKEIAAKLQNSKDVNGSQDFDSRKRSFNGEEPVSKRPMTMDGGYMNQNSSAQGNLKDEIRVPGSVVQYLSGETLGRLQAQTGCHVQIPPPGPDANAERAIALTGNRQCIENCKEQIKDIVHQYAPQAPIGGMPGAGGFQGGGMEHQGAVETVDMLIPQNKVGLVIGRGGETIKDLALQSGCKMNMVQDGIYANAAEKPLRMHGSSFQIQKARELVSGIIQQQEFQNRNNFGNNQGHGGGGGQHYQQNQGPFEASSNLPVAKEYVGIIIGRGGDTIKRLQSETGAKVQFNTIDPNVQGDRYLIIQGTKAQVAEVETRIKDLLQKVQQKDTRHGGPGFQQIEVPVPANKCGLVIGKKGETINRMKEQTGAHIEMNKHSPHDAPMKQFVIKGNPEQIKQAQAEIAKIVGDSDSPYGGGMGGGYNQRPPMHGHGGPMGAPHGGSPMMAPGAGAGDPAALAYQQQMAYYSHYYQQQQQMAAQQQAMQQQAPAAAPSQPPAQQPPSAAAAPPQAGAQSVQQQWAAYYQQLVHMYGEQQAQMYWTQLSQQQQQTAAPPQ